MARQSARIVGVGLFMSLAACSGLGVSPVSSEPRSVHPQADAQRTLTVLHDLVYADRSPARAELRLPAGTYVLEASDEGYWYLRCNSALELKQTQRGGHVDTRRLSGGIMLGKYAFRAVPAAAYIDGDGATTRLLIWKLPAAFLAGEGRDWRRSF